MTTRSAIVVLESLVGGLWSALAVLNGKLAQDKGEPGFKWVLLSLPLGPLATVLIMTRPVVNPRSDE